MTSKCNPVEIWVHTTTTIPEPPRQSIKSASSTEFSCSNVIPRYTPPEHHVEIHFIITQRDVLCVPSYSNDHLLGKAAKYIPYGWTQPLAVVVKKIAGKGPHRDVELDCLIPQSEHIVHGIEHGILLFSPDASSGQSLHYRPSHSFTTKRAVRDMTRLLIGKIWKGQDKETVKTNTRVAGK